MTITHARGPLRIGLAGGGSDVDPFCSNYGGRVLNATISKYVHCKVSSLSENPTRLASIDRGITLDYDDDESLQDVLPLHKNTYKYFCATYLGGEHVPLEISTYTDAPVGSGLGTSSTMVVTMVKALAEHFKISIDNYEVAHAAQVIEREMCKFSGGRQDQFSATFGGFNFMEFEKESNLINPLRVPRQTVLNLESNLLLFHMGTSRLSSKIIAEQAKTVESDSSSAWQAMMKIREEASIMKTHLLKGDLGGVVTSLIEGWENKKRTSTAVSSGLIDLIYKTGLDAGALAGKVSGAGGGGFMLFFVPISNRKSLTQALKPFEGYTTSVEFVDHGAEAWNE
ncbi:hypothetical protein [Rhodoluna lacicola]|uniref:GHMP family kinase ATP-binding protein n=1 Tax=Rhodoluna lacicola TaxID=529884 RepID=UPI00222F8454|nr:hypothetical protein [Rhodoluna lacicola]BDS49753.1 dehydrogenase [Rhodoluna lacicola]